MLKHPFQIVVANKAGTHLFCSVKNHLYVFSLENGALAGSWVDSVDITAKLKKKQEQKIKAKDEKLEKIEPTEQSTEKAEEKPEKVEVTENVLEGVEESNKKLKSNAGTPVKVQKAQAPVVPQIYNYIRSLRLSDNEKYLVGTTDSDKAVIIFELDFTSSNCLNLIKRQSFLKRPCAVSIVDDVSLVVADKFGDVFQIQIDAEQPIDEKLLVPILGHVSMLSDVLVASYNNKKYILTGDRDEHIRISNFPKAYVINNWLWGHREFVSSMHIPSYDPSILISGGGDEYLCVWTWFDSKLLKKIQLREFIEPYLTDNHMPPERFLTDASVKEITVSRVFTFVNPSSNKKLLIVLVENTNAILTFDIDNDYKHSQTFVTEKPLVDITVDEVNSRIITSTDIESDTDLLEFYSIDEDNLITHEGKNEITKSIASANECNVESREDFYPLYYINTLRKRSEH